MQLIVCAILMCWLPAVLAHARLVKSMPAANATLQQAPLAIQLWFNEPPEVAFCRIQLSSPVLPKSIKGKPQRAKEKNSLIWVFNTALVPGEYVVRARVLSVDGHRMKVRFSFRIIAPP